MCTVSTIYAISFFFYAYFYCFYSNVQNNTNPTMPSIQKGYEKCEILLKKEIIIRIWSGESICFSEKVISMWKVDKKILGSLMLMVAAHVAKWNALESLWCGVFAYSFSRFFYAHENLFYFFGASFLYKPWKFFFHVMWIFQRIMHTMRFFYSQKMYKSDIVLHNIKNECFLYVFVKKKLQIKVW